MRDMMATHERLTPTPSETRESVRKAAAAAYEALPAILLAAALLMPAVAAIAQRAALSEDFERQAVEARTGISAASLSIAAQGNEALVAIRAEALETARAGIVLPELP